MFCLLHSPFRIAKVLPAGKIPGRSGEKKTRVPGDDVCERWRKEANYQTVRDQSSLDWRVPQLSRRDSKRVLKEVCLYLEYVQVLLHGGGMRGGSRVVRARSKRRGGGHWLHAGKVAGRERECMGKDEWNYGERKKGESGETQRNSEGPAARPP